MADIKATMSLDAGQVLQSLQKVSKQANNTKESVAKGAQQLGYGISGFKSVGLQLANSMGVWGMAAAAAVMIITAGITAAVKSTISFANKLDGLAKQAKSMDMGINAFMGLRHACNLAGADLEKVMNIINRVEQAALGAVDGNKKYQDSFHEIGLSWLEMSKMSPEQKIMALVAAVRRLKEEGKQLPTSFVDQLVGRKGVQTVNKLAADPTFERNIIGAELEGFGFDPAVVSQAEALNDAVSNVGDAFTVWASKLQAVQWMMENLEDISNTITKNMAGTSSYRVDPKYEQYTIDIGRSTDYMLANSSFTAAQQRKMLEEYGQHLKNELAKTPNAGGEGSSLMMSIDTPAESATGIDVNKASDEEILKKFAEMFGNKVDEMNDAQRAIIFKYTAENDKRFNADDRTTWIQLRKTGFNKGTLTQDNATEEMVQNIERMDISKMKELYNVEEAIAEVEDVLNQRLDRRHKTMLQIAADAKNQAIYEQNVAAIEEKMVEKAERSVQLDTAHALHDTSHAMLQAGYKDASRDAAMSEVAKRYDGMVVGSDYKPVELLDVNPEEYSSTEEYRKAEDEAKKRRAEFLDKKIWRGTGSYYEIVGRNSAYTKGEFTPEVAIQQLGISNPEKYTDYNGRFSLEEYEKQLQELYEKAFDEKGRLQEAIANDTSIANGNDPLGLQAAYDEASMLIEDIEKKTDKLYTFLSERSNHSNFGRVIDSETFDSLSILEDIIAEENKEREIKLKETPTSLKEFLGKAAALRKELGNGNLVDLEFKLSGDGADNLKAIMSKYNMTIEDLKRAQALENEIAQEQLVRGEYNAQLNVINLTQEQIDLIERKNLLVQAGLKPTEENLELYKEQLDYLQQIEERQKHVNLMTSMKNDLQDFGFDFMEATGNKVGAAFARGRAKAEKTKGSYLTEEETQMVDTQTNLGLLLDYIKSFKMEDNAVHTNELAQRGGFTGSVVVEPNDNQRKQVELLQAIRRATELTNSLQIDINRSLIGY